MHPIRKTNRVRSWFKHHNIKTLLILNLKISHGVKPLTLVMVDTGANISIIKKNALIPFNFTVNNHKIISLQGITQNKTHTLGSVNLPILFTAQFSVMHEFYLVESNFPIFCDAIMGTDFLSQADAIIDFKKMVFSCSIIIGWNSK